MHVWSGRSDFKKRNVSSEQGPASSLTYPAILVLEIAIPWGSHLPPSSKPSTSLMILLGLCGAQLTHPFQWSRMSL